MKKNNNLKIGFNYPPFIVAEISANHNQSLKLALRMIDEAAKCGVSAIKIQTYTPNSLTINSEKKDFLIKKNNPWGKKKYLWNLYKKAQTSIDLTSKVFKYAKSVGMEIFSSPFDESALDFLEKLKCPAYKIASAESNHIPLLEKVAKTKKPVI